VPKKREELNPAAQLYLARQLAERGTCPTDDAFREAYPTLWSLCTTWWIDDTHRVEACRLEVSVMGGDWLFKLSSPSMRGHAQCLAQTFALGIAKLEAQLSGPDPGWSFWLKRRASIAQVQPEKNGLAKLDGK
jgi:hypothetical protein